ncbi:hypothetical protein [Azohydromonas caseinilytica]|uniref:Uncharacterized protein n=1 Tax=Azohydromonas caseinilytica TaxID=2728836 RepID=A0A848F8A4_9BURK|nr:hypothetical protein [Azohydromonas caseinilytica]NML14996.1 hypothetical protein [Azohydromonas caseinilytica]
MAVERHLVFSRPRPALPHDEATSKGFREGLRATPPSGAAQGLVRWAFQLMQRTDAVMSAETGKT